MERGDQVAFAKRTTTPDLSLQWWKTSYSACITGSAAESRTYGVTLPNCFSGDTEIITHLGVKRLSDIVGSSVKIPTIDNEWHDAEIKYFGKQILWEVKLNNGHTYKASGNHRWVIYSQSGKTHKIVHTQDLIPGMFVNDTFSGEVNYPDDLDGIRHGFVYGDGTCCSNIHTCANICGFKKTFMPRYFEGFKITEWADGTLYVGGQCSDGKKVPEYTLDKAYLYNFLRGYFAADGSVDADGYASITSSDFGNLSKVNDICWILGIKTTGVRQQYDNGYTGYRWIYNLTLRRDSLDSSFFLNPVHKSRFEAKPKKHIHRTTIKSVRCLHIEEDVYCPVEPITHTCTLGGGELTGQCVGYAWGRFAEIMNAYPTGLPAGDAGTWYSSDTTHEKSSDPQKPRLGAVIVWKKPGAAGHVAIVEEIERDSSGTVISVTTSESGWGNSWSNRFFTSKRYPPNYSSGSYQFQGFIYNPAVSKDESGTVDISNENHPARKFVAEAASHIGAGGHEWVQKNTSIGNSAWCAATMCAVAKACGYAGVIMPEANYWASGFGQDIIEKYGGEYHAGPMMGGSFTPQVGDIIEYSNAGNSGTYNAGTKYAAYHVGVVKEVVGDKVYTIEGNTDGGQYKQKEKDLNGSNIGWYARPDWTKVGGSMNVDGWSYGSGGDLYTTKSTRADASIREVGYLTSKGEPSIKATGVKLSVINYTGLLSKFVKTFGGSSNSSSGSPDSIDGLPAVPREIVSYLTGKGLNTAAAIGVIANIKAESNFNTAAVGDYGTSFGICQWHNNRGTAMKKMAGSNWASNLTGQLDYLWYELSNSYTSVLSALQSVPNTLEGAKSAADTFVRKFEIPADIEGQSKIRQSNAEEYWNMIVVSPTSSPSGDNSAAQGQITKRDGTKITQGTSVSIPSSVPQTGIVANYTSYTQFYGRWAGGTIQKQLSEIWAQQGKPHTHCVATISGYYLVAVTLKFGTTGDIISVVFKDGTYFNAIIGDSKGSNAGSEWGHYLGSQIDIIEWEAYGTDQSALRSGLNDAGFLGKKVDRIINYGSWL